MVLGWISLDNSGFNALVLEKGTKMLRIYRVEETEAIDYISDKFEDTSDETKESAVISFKELLINCPDYIRIFTAYDIVEGEEPVLQAFVAAFAPNEGRLAWISQIWCSDELVDPTTMKRLFFRLVCWAEEKGKTKIQCETSDQCTRHLEAWKFSLVTKTLAYEIPENFDLTTIGGGENGTKTKDDISDNAGRGQNSGSTVGGSAKACGGGRDSEGECNRETSPADTKRPPGWVSVDLSSISTDEPTKCVSTLTKEC